MAGKTGADAVSRSLARICGTIKRYRVKLDLIISAAGAAGIISIEDVSTAHAFVAAAAGTCAIFEKIADFNSVNP